MKPNVKYKCIICNFKNYSHKILIIVNFYVRNTRKFIAITKYIKKNMNFLLNMHITIEKIQVVYRAQKIFLNLEIQWKNLKPLNAMVIPTSSCNCYKSFNIRNVLKFQNGVETRICKLNFVSQAWIQRISSWRPKLYFSYYKDNFLNKLHSIDHFGFYEVLEFIIILIWTNLFTCA